MNSKEWLIYFALLVLCYTIDVVAAADDERAGESLLLIMFNLIINFSFSNRETDAISHLFIVVENDRNARQYCSRMPSKFSIALPKPSKQLRRTRAWIILFVRRHANSFIESSSSKTPENR